MTQFPDSPAARYLALADSGHNAWWRYVLGVIFIAACWLVGGSYAYRLVLLVVPVSAVGEFIAINASVLMLLFGVLVVIAVLHRRPWRTLVTPQPRIAWRRMAEGAGVWVALAVVCAVIEHLMYPGRYAWNLDLQRWLPFVLAALLLTPLQCAAEELVFRGYLMQALGRLSRHPVLPAILSSAIFTLPHLYNPEVAAYGIGIMAANYFVMGLFLAGIALRDGRLELAIGAHAGNNLLLALFINYDNSAFDTAALFTAGALDPVFSLATLILSALLFHRWVFRRISSPA